MNEVFEIGSEYSGGILTKTPCKNCGQSMENHFQLQFCFAEFVRVQKLENRVKELENKLNKNVINRN